MKSFDIIMSVLLSIAIAALVILLNSCQLPSVTVHGQYGDYSFKPRQPVIIEPAK